MARASRWAGLAVRVKLPPQPVLQADVGLRAQSSDPEARTREEGWDPTPWWIAALTQVQPGTSLRRKSCLGRGPDLDQRDPDPLGRLRPGESRAPSTPVTGGASWRDQDAGRWRDLDPGPGPQGGKEECGWRDLNSQGRSHTPLKRACLPIPPHPRGSRPEAAGVAVQTAGSQPQLLTSRTIPIA